MQRYGEHSVLDILRDEPQHPRMYLASGTNLGIQGTLVSMPVSLQHATGRSGAFCAPDSTDGAPSRDLLQAVGTYQQAPRNGDFSGGCTVWSQPGAWPGPGAGGLRCPLRGPVRTCMRATDALGRSVLLPPRGAPRRTQKGPKKQSHTRHPPVPPLARWLTRTTVAATGAGGCKPVGASSPLGLASFSVLFFFFFFLSLLVRALSFSLSCQCSDMALARIQSRPESFESAQKPVPSTHPSPTTR